MIKIFNLKFGTCGCCEIVFIQKSGNHKYCSIKCRRKKYYENNKEKFSEKGKKYRMIHKEDLKERKKHFYENNKEKISEKAKQYRESHKDVLKERRKHFYENNKEKILEKQQQYLWRIFEECEQEIMRDTITHRVFSFLFQNPYSSCKDLIMEFFEEDTKSINLSYSHFMDIVYEKYILGKRITNE